MGNSTYHYEDTSAEQGYPYYYYVAAFDDGTANGVDFHGRTESLESSKYTNLITQPVWLNHPVQSFADTATALEYQIIDIPVLQNDTDLDGDYLQIADIIQPENGGAAAYPNALILAYLAAPYFTGNDTLKYIATDGKGSFDTASVIIKVEPNPDPGILPEWQKSYGHFEYNQGYSVHGTSDGGYIIVGSTEHPTDDDYIDHDILLIKADASGNLIWKQTIGTEFYEEAFSVLQTSDDGYILVGTRGLDRAGIEFRLWLIKTNSSGDTLWTRDFGETWRDHGYSLQLTDDDGFIISGTTWGGDDTDMDSWIIRTDANGEELWNRIIKLDGDQQETKILSTSDNGYILMSDHYSLPWEPADMLLVKLNSQADIVWSNSYGGYENDEGSCIQEVEGEGYIITGMTESEGNGNEDMWLLKTDLFGNLDWSQTYGGENSDYGSSVCQVPGGFIVCGETEEPGPGIAGWIMLIDEEGNTHWQQKYGGVMEESFRFVQESYNNDFIFCGSTSSFNKGNSMVWLALYNNLPLEVLKIDNIVDRLPIRYKLDQNYPNPFNPITMINYQLPKTSDVELSIYNLLGQKVATLVNERQRTGYHQVEWDASRFSSGIYYYRIETGEFQDVKKMILLR